MRFQAPVFGHQSLDCCVVFCIPVYTAWRLTRALVYLAGHCAISYSTGRVCCHLYSLHNRRDRRRHWRRDFHQCQQCKPSLLCSLSKPFFLLPTKFWAPDGGAFFFFFFWVTKAETRLRCLGRDLPVSAAQRLFPRFPAVFLLLVWRKVSFRFLTDLSDPTSCADRSQRSGGHCRTSPYRHEPYQSSRSAWCPIVLLRKVLQGKNFRQLPQHSSLPHCFRRFPGSSRGVSGQRSVHLHRPCRGKVVLI